MLDLKFERIFKLLNYIVLEREKWVEAYGFIIIIFFFKKSTDKKSNLPISIAKTIHVQLAIDISSLCCQYKSDTSLCFEYMIESIHHNQFWVNYFQFTLDAFESGLLKHKLLKGPSWYYCNWFDCGFGV